MLNNILNSQIKHNIKELNRQKKLNEIKNRKPKQYQTKQVSSDEPLVPDEKKNIPISSRFNIDDKDITDIEFFNINRNNVLNIVNTITDIDNFGVDNIETTNNDMHSYISNNIEKNELTITDLLNININNKINIKNTISNISNFGPDIVGTIDDKSNITIFNRYNTNNNMASIEFLNTDKNNIPNKITNNRHKLMNINNTIININNLGPDILGITDTKKYYKYKTTSDTVTNNPTPKPLLNKNIKKINYVYQSSYINEKTTGFGDFIRGCFYILEYCSINKLEYDFHIFRHHLQKYLKYFQKKQPISIAISKNICKFIDINASFVVKNKIIDYKIITNHDNAFIYYLNSCENFNGNIYINTTNFPNHNIPINNIKFMNQVLQPTDEIIELVNIQLNELKLVKKNYITFHIRFGDAYLLKETNLIDSSRLNRLIEKIKITKNQDYLLITDCQILKTKLIENFPNLKVTSYDIGHICENDEIGIKNTLIDFYLISYSKSIISYSVYNHGSGFSKWCSVVYNIPYVCHYIG